MNSEGRQRRLWILAFSAAAGILCGCDPYHGVSEKQLIGVYKFVADDAGRPHEPESLVITATSACETHLGPPAQKPICTPWAVLRGNEDQLLIGKNSMIIEKGGKIRLIVDPDSYWFFDKIS